MLSDTAIILRSVNYKESDKILTLFTRTRGKISAIAKGARKSAKRFGGALQPFAVFEASLAQSRRGSSAMFTISEASMLSANEGLSRDLDRLGAAAYLLELVREVAPEHDSSASLFDLVVDALRLLSDGEAIFPRGVMLAAGMRVLAQSGLAMSVGHCNSCGTVVPAGKSVYFDALRGGVVCSPCGGGAILLDGATATALVFMERHPLHEAAQLVVDDAILDSMEKVFETFVRVHVEKQLRTPAFMGQLKSR